MTRPISRELTARTEILAAMARCRPDALVRLAEIVRAYEAMPEAWDEVLAVLRDGRPGAGYGPDWKQDSIEHVAALLRHAYRLTDGGGAVNPEHRDHDSGRLTLGHVVSRGVIAMYLELTRAK